MQGMDSALGEFYGGNSSIVKRARGGYKKYLGPSGSMTREMAFIGREAGFSRPTTFAERGLGISLNYDVVSGKRKGRTRYKRVSGGARLPYEPVSGVYAGTTARSRGGGGGIAGGMRRQPSGGGVYVTVRAQKRSAPRKAAPVRKTRRTPSKGKTRTA